MLVFFIILRSSIVSRSYRSNIKAYDISYEISYANPISFPSLSLSLSKKIKRDLYLSELAAKHFSKWTNISIVTSSLPPH